MTTSEAVAARDALLDMLGAGILESGHGDKRIKFATFDELRARSTILTGSFQVLPMRGPRWSRAVWRPGMKTKTEYRPD